MLEAENIHRNYSHPQEFFPSTGTAPGCFSSPVSLCRHLAAKEAELGEGCDHVFSFSLSGKGVLSGFCFRTFLPFRLSDHGRFYDFFHPWMLWSVRKEGNYCVPERDPATKARQNCFVFNKNMNQELLLWIREVFGF